MSNHSCCTEQHLSTSDLRPKSRLNRHNNYRPQTKLREGYVFTGVCDSLHVGGGIPACIAGLQAHTQVGQKVEGSPGP